MRLRINREFLVGLIAVLLGLAAGALLMLATGNEVLEGYRFLFAGGLMNLERIGNTLATATPLVLTGLSVAFAFRTGLFNIGTPGQVLIGGMLGAPFGAWAAKHLPARWMLILVGMVLTPPDPLSQTLLAVPMWLLFEVGLFFGRLIRKRPADEAADDADNDQPPAVQP